MLCYKVILVWSINEPEKSVSVIHLMINLNVKTTLTLQVPRHAFFVIVICRDNFDKILPYNPYYLWITLNTTDYLERRSIKKNPPQHLGS